MPSAQRRRARAARIAFAMEALEPRVLLSTSVLTYHDDSSRNGEDLTETLLMPANVNSSDFGALATTPVDGQIYAQPLYVPGVDITSGSSQGVHNVVYVATENDSLYAIDADSGQILWKDSFLVSTQSGVDVTTGQVGYPTTVSEGVTSTPVIDSSTGTIYVCALTEAYSNGQNNYIYSLHAIDIASGAEKFGGPTVIADTIYDATSDTFTYVSGPSVAGDGDGSVDGVVHFTVPRQDQRVGLTLADGNVYIAFASYNTDPPYHGWILGYSASTLQPTAVFCTTPNGYYGGIWQSGGSLAVDAEGNLYVATGNGTFDGTLNPTTQLPIDADYGDTVLKLSVDPDSSPSDPNPNGWGLKVSDYFTPDDQAALFANDEDLGSGGVMLLPQSAGGPDDPNLLLAGGKEGIIYLINMDDMGKYNPDANDVVQQISIAPGEIFDTAAYYDGSIYDAGSFSNNVVNAFSISDGVMSTRPTSQSTDTFGYPSPTASISADGDTNGIVWVVESSGELRAYNAANLADELYTSDQAPDGRDLLGPVNHFVVPTVADGHVFVGTMDSLVIYGLLPSADVPPIAIQSLTVRAVSNTQIELTWPLRLTNATGYVIQREESSDGVFSTIAVLSGDNITSYTDSGLSLGVQYTYRILATDAGGDSAYYSNLASATISLAWHVVGSGDFTGNGTSDPLLFNTSTGEVGIWILNGGSAPTWEELGVTTLQVAGVGDFNGDGTSDVLLKNPSSGLLGVWTISSGRVTAWTPLATLPSGWQLAGIGDFTGNGTSDLLIRNTVNGLTGTWLVSDNHVTTWSLFGTVQPGFWTISSVGDINGDGTSDVLLWNIQTGMMGAWLINNAQVTSWTPLGTADPTTWEVDGIGVYNPGSTSDIMLTNTSNGVTGAWLIDSGTVSSWQMFGVASPSNWNVAATGDFNDDGITDILLSDPMTGLVGTWLTSDDQFSAWQPIGTLLS